LKTKPFFPQTKPLGSDSKPLVGLLEVRENISLPFSGRQNLSFRKQMDLFAKLNPGATILNLGSGIWKLGSPRQPSENLFLHPESPRRSSQNARERGNLP
jgi:hypothetical protein